METAIAYIRVSDLRQVIDGNSLATQERQVRDHAKSRGYDLLRVFIEQGETAKTDERTVLREMLAYCRENAGKIKVLIFPKIDRFARYLPDYISLKGQLTRLGIRVDSVGEPIEDTPAGRLTEFMLAAIAQFDNEIRAERSRGGAIQAAREGRWVTRPPFGFRRIRYQGRVTIEPDPDKSQVIVEMFTRLSYGHELAQVRRWLGSKGIGFSRSYVHRMVRNRVYVGVIDRYGESNVGAPPFVPLISRNLFEAAQLAIRPKKMPKTYSRDNPDFPLRGTLRCECGHLLMGGWAHGRSQRYAHYRCHWCPRVNHRREVVHRAFCRLLRAKTPDESYFERIQELVKVHAQALGKEVQIRRELLERQCQQLHELKRAIGRKVVSGVLPDDLAKEQIGETECQIVSANLQLSKLSLPESGLAGAVDFAKDLLHDLDVRWRDSDVLNQKRLQRFAFPDGLTLTRKCKLRTAKSGRLTGLDVLSKARLSSIVHRGHKRPNPVACTKQRRLTEQLSQISSFLKELHQKFSSEAPWP